jgi:hypothetical protein
MELEDLRGQKTHHFFISPENIESGIRSNLIEECRENLGRNTGAKVIRIM